MASINQDGKVQRLCYTLLQLAMSPGSGGGVHPYRANQGGLRCLAGITWGGTTAALPFSLVLLQD